jgi:hypothetical protein
MQPLPIVTLLDEFFDVHTHVPKVFWGEPPSWYSFLGTASAAIHPVTPNDSMSRRPTKRPKLCWVFFQ